MKSQVKAKREVLFAMFHPKRAFVQESEPMPQRLEAKAILIPMLLAMKGNHIHGNPGDKSAVDAGLFGEISDYRLFDYGNEPLPSDIKLGQIPRPGIVFALHRELIGDDIQSAMRGIELVQNLKQRPGVKEYLTSPAAYFQAAPVPEYDVFLSFSHKDEEFVVEVEQARETQGLKVYRSEKDLQAGELWIDAIREALTVSRYVVLVLTPTSVKSNWVMIEAGAAWAIETPTIVAHRHITLGELPEALLQRQHREIDTNGKVLKLAAELKKLVAADSLPPPSSPAP